LGKNIETLWSFSGLNATLRGAAFETRITQKAHLLKEKCVALQVMQFSMHACNKCIKNKKKSEMQNTCFLRALLKARDSLDFGHYKESAPGKTKENFSFEKTGFPLDNGATRGIFEVFHTQHTRGISEDAFPRTLF
jgi:hypothetical protein